MIPDVDLINSMNVASYNTSRVIGSLIHYLIKQIDTLLTRRKEDLLDKKPGALSEEATKVIWVRMLKRPNIDPTLASPKLQALKYRGKFNSILEERIAEDGMGNHLIISIDISPYEFDYGGKITLEGQYEFWCEMIKGLKKFDQKEITLRLRGSKAAATNSRMGPNNRNPLEHGARKLPTPPPRRSSSKSSSIHNDKVHHKYDDWSQ